MYDVTVIGAGPGGITTAIYAARAGKKVALIERGLYGGQLHNTEEVENYTGFTTVGGAELAKEMEEHVKNINGIDHIYGSVQSIREKGTGTTTFEVHLETDIIQSKTVTIATGVTHKKLDVPGEAKYEGMGVSYCAVCDGAFFRNKRVAVIGGGDAALESALYLADIAEKITVIHRRDELRAEQVLQDRAYEKENISFVWDAEVQKVTGGNVASGVYYNDKKNSEIKHLTSSGIFVNIGIIPVTEFLHQSNVGEVLTEENFIKTDARMRTSIPGLYAIGDVRADSVRQVVSATGDGAVASEDMIRYLGGEVY